MKQIRQLDNGDWVVDLGRKWFRLKQDGTVLGKQIYRPRGAASFSVKKFEPSAAEIKFAKDQVTIFCGNNF